MKKIALLAFASAALFCTGVASAQEVTYVEDCSQGLLINKAKDNWFITFEGGANFLYGYDDIHADIKNRIGAQAGIYVGKWFNPVWGARLGVKGEILKGATPGATDMYTFHKYMGGVQLDNGYYEQRSALAGAELGLQLNVTNWWCGYNPKRTYNAILRGSGAFYWSFYRGTKYGNVGDVNWRNAHDTFLSVSLGLVNNFRLSDRVSIFLEPRAELLDVPRAEGVFSLNAGVTINLGKTDWNCPVTAVCPEPEYTAEQIQALESKLGQANNEIKSLRSKLEDCDLKFVETKPAVQQSQNLVTVYYPINQYSLSAREKTILKSVAEVMRSNPNTVYQLTGWADNFTGNEEINNNLRWKRVDGVKNYLVNKCGVNPDQISTGINSGSLNNSTEKASAPLDRAVTINEK